VSAVAPLDLRTRARPLAPNLGELSSELRSGTIATWRARMLNEYASASVFEALGRQLAVCFPPEVARECAGFAEEERRHGVLCGAVVEAAGGEARGVLSEASDFPEHADAPGRAAALRNVIHVCCLSETVAVSLIGAERLEMPPGSLRRQLTRIYADEIGHARFGWRLLERVAPELSFAERAAIERYLPTAFAHLEAHELSHLPEREPPAGGAALGLCVGADGRRLFYDTLERVIVPGLRRWFRC
jgi:hypothetical protein